MSSTADYSLEIKLDDAQLRRQIEEIKKAFGTGGGKRGGSGGGDPSGTAASIDKVFGGLAKKGMFSLISMGLKLSGMAIAMEKMSKALVGASPMLQQMLKLLDTGIMFMLRPIGDFIGFLLKPIVLFFFKYVAIPFYRYIEPFMQKYGTAIGNALTDPTIGIPAMVGTLFALKLVADKILTGVGNFTADTIGAGVKKGMKDYDTDKAASSTSNNAASDKGTTKKTTTTSNKPKDPFDPNTDLGGGKAPSNGASVSVDPRTGRITVTTKSGTSATSPSQGGVKISPSTGKSIEGDLGGDSLTGGQTKALDLKSLQTYVSRATGAKASVLNDAQKMIADRISGGDYEYAKSMVKLAPKVLKGVLKFLPELGVLIAAITGDASWIVPGYGGTAGGGESDSSLPYNNPPPAFRPATPGQGILSIPNAGTQNGGTNINITVANQLNDPTFLAGLKNFITGYMQQQNSRRASGQ